YSAFESLRDLKRRIAAQVQQKGMQDNIKLGPGGIREIEFTGQAFQLVRGGREPTLRQGPILDVLDAVKQLGLLPAGDVDGLTAAYDYLRRVENYLQMMRDEQVHALPENQEDQARLRFAMGYRSWEEFTRDLASHRAHVQSVFQSLFHTDTDENPADELDDPLATLWLSGAVEDFHADELETLGFERPGDVRVALAELANSAFYRGLTQQAQQRLDRLVPMLLHEVSRHSGSWRALQGLLRLVRGVAGRSVYLQVLIETPAALELITRLFSRSTFIADFVCQHPIVIDELLDYRNIENPPDRETMVRDAAFALERVVAEELDVQMDALRQFQQANMIRVAAAELEGQIDLMSVSDRLTWLAEITLQAVSDLVWDQMIDRYGRPECVVESAESVAEESADAKTVVRTPGFSIVAYGKLGGLELSYASDLDIVFLHESEGTEQRTQGPKVVENQVFFARLAQKIVHFISTFTPAGVLYDIDTRLRPNGQSGMLVSSLSAFELYHQQEAWTWEHQALVRARVVVGNDRIKWRFAAIRSAVLCRDRQADALRQEVAAMRQRMRAELGGSGDTFDLKQDLGGIADIEFMVQYMVLWKSSAHIELTTETDNVRLLQRIGKLGFITRQMADDLCGAYLEFRRYTHRLALLDQKAVISVSGASGEWSTDELADLAEHRSRVQLHWHALMESAPDD
ncbi:MAG: bifunctional [glutamate--ammonia ligase]-adenylyl-L-tyrosine phosphorylase/[glutamate--ammonia-ligase] adenylyltransferase, partial [Granulosicoccus sp.]|nr:bifunctional [glutamate--ammonia ligase]-adenylyl-L-tyrosine phosphorylase/[glutamate--ammonia-ligase] adenylyltransferase [Granulosicoccus sp.]